MKRGDVWWVEFDPSLDSEIRKTRLIKTKIGTLTKADMAGVEQAILVQLGMPK